MVHCGFSTFQVEKQWNTHFQPQILSTWPIFPNDSESLPKVCYINWKKTQKFWAGGSLCSEVAEIKSDLTHSLAHSLSERQGHLLSCPGQLTTKGKWGKFIINMSDSFDFACLSVLSIWHCLIRFSFTVRQRERRDKEEEKSYKKDEQVWRQGSLLFSKYEFSIKPDLRGLSFS